MKAAVPQYFNNLIQLATRPMTVQREEWPGQAFYKIGKVRCVCIPLQDGARVLYVEGRDFSQACQQEYAKVASKSGWREHLKLYESGKKLLARTEQLIDRASVNKKILGQAYASWINFTDKWGVFGFFPFVLEEFIDKEFRRLTKESYPNEYEEILLAISSPLRLNSYQEMRLAICRQALRPSSRGLTNLVRKYHWYNEYSFIEPLHEKSFFQDEVLRLSKQTALEESNKIIQEIKNNKKRYRKIINRIKDKKIKLLAEIINHYTFLRTDRIDVYKKGQAKARVIYDLLAVEFSEQSGEPWKREQVVNLLNKEIFDYLEKGILPDKKEVEKRMKDGYVYYFDADGGHIATDPKFIAGAQDSILNKKIDQEIKGQIACPGKASGKVVIVNGKGDLKKVGVGDILVARITMPDYTPVMKLASAFVTEEGGITSHAAIVARELGKPCIVGTGNCTKILRDGDLVEVNADKGIVQIIKKSK